MAKQWPYVMFTVCPIYSQFVQLGILDTAGAEQFTALNEVYITVSDRPVFHSVLRISIEISVVRERIYASVQVSRLTLVCGYN